MKKNIALLIFIIVVSCKKEAKIEKTKVTTKEEVTQVIASTKKALVKKGNFTFNFTDFKGFYVGSFKMSNLGKGSAPSYSNKINISLDSISKKDNILFGHSVVAGNNRLFKGNYSFNEKTKSIKAIVYEPGDDKYDGNFDLECFAKENKLTGKWIANNKNIAVNERKYNLKKKKFKYNKNENMIIDEFEEFEANIPLYDKNTYYDSGKKESITIDILKFNASNTKLTYKDVENLKKGDLEIIRNTIYARHGYSFKNRRMRYFFDEYIDWYIPVTTDIRNVLTSLEKENIDLLKRYEKHAEKYYDYFGR